MRFNTIFKFITILFCHVSIHAQMYKKNNIILESNIGYPNFFSSWTVDDRLDLFQVDLNSIRNLGPMTFKIEKLLDKRLGVSIDVGYTQVDLEYQKKFIDGTQNGSYTYDTANYIVSIKKIKVIPTLNFHFTRRNTKLDGYIFAGFGYRARILNVNTNDPTYKVQYWPFVPIGFRFGMGYRYFPIKNVGLNASVAIGGPLLSAGLAIKF